MFGRDEKKIKDYMCTSFQFIWFLSLPITLGIISIASNLVPWFFGNEFLKVKPLLYIFSFALIPQGLYAITGSQYLVSTKKQNGFTLSIIFGAIINFCLNFILIPKYYSIGAAIASVVADIIISAIQIIYIVFILKELNLKDIFGKMLKYVIASLLMFSIVFPLGNWLVPSFLHTGILILIGASVYIFVLILFKDELIKIGKLKVKDFMMKRKRIMNKYEVVILGNGTDWCELSLSDIKKYKNVRLINEQLPYNPKKFMARLSKLHYSSTISQYINLPFKHMWFKYFANYIEKDSSKNLILIIYDRNRLATNIKFLNYLRKHFKNIKLVYIFTNVVRISGAKNANFVEKLKSYYDIVFLFDKGDMSKYSFPILQLPYSLNDVETTYSDNKVFYCGRAKDRYNMLISIYDKLKSIDVSRKFYIFNVDGSEQKYKDEIVYNKLITYKEVIKNVKESDCILDIIQGESSSFTLKVCEAVYYDKLLITTNHNVKTAPFYNPDFVKVIDSADEIDKSFFKNIKNVKYSEVGKKYFSVESYLERILNEAGLNLDVIENY